MAVTGKQYFPPSLLQITQKLQGGIRLRPQTAIHTAGIDFKYTLDHCRENSPNKAYHLIQAFAPGGVSFEEAHQIGKELADKVLEGQYS